MRGALVIGIGVVVALAACGSSAPPRDGDAARSYCDAYKKWELTCPRDDVEADYQRCMVEDGPCQARRMRPDALAAITACIASIECTRDGRSCTCSKNEDDCYAAVGNAAAASPHRDAYERACRVKLDVCGRGATGFSDDYCTGGGWASLKDDVFDALRPCFDGECTSVAPCIKRTMDVICHE